MATASDSLDWLGAIQKSNDYNDDFRTPGRRESRSRKPDADDDWLGLGAEPSPVDKSIRRLGSSELPTSANSIDDADDWLGLSGAKNSLRKNTDDDDWLGQGTAKKKEVANPASGTYRVK